ETIPDHCPAARQVPSRLPPGREHDQRDAAIARLTPGECEQRGLADEVAAITRDDVPEIVTVSQPLGEADALGRGVRLVRGRLERGIDEALRRDRFGTGELGVGPSERTGRQAFERLAIGDPVEQRRVPSEDALTLRQATKTLVL